MKRAIPLILIGAVIGGGGVWLKQRGDAAKPAAQAASAEKPASDEPEPPHATRDADGRVIITMDDEIQGNMGILVAQPTAIQLAPEVKGYGRVLDPAPLAALLSELASAQVAATATSHELTRLKMLEGQGNASARALQTAEAAAMRDQLAVQSARDRLALSSGKAIADQKDLMAFVQSLTSQDAALVRIDLPAGESMESLPGGARVFTVSGQSVNAGFLGAAAGIDPQLQGRGFVYLVKPNALPLLAGQAVTGFLKVAGAQLSGVIVPREAVIRTEGAGWVYILNKGGDVFTRTEIPLDRPVEAGWFVTKGVTENDYVVGTGAQQLLSIELKGQGGE